MIVVAEALLALLLVAGVAVMLGMVLRDAITSLGQSRQPRQVETAPQPTLPRAAPPDTEKLTEADYAAINALERATGQEVTDYSAEVSVLRARERPAVRALLELQDAVVATPAENARVTAAVYGYLSAIEEMIEVERGNVLLVEHRDRARTRFHTAQQQFLDATER